MSTLAEIYQLEKHIETGVSTLLDGTTANIYTSRETTDLASERIEIKAILGENLEHRHPFSDGSSVFDVWTATLELTVATNRGENSQNHSELLGKVRARITKKYFDANFTHEIIVTLDVRDSGTIDSFSDENDIDISTLSFYLVVNVKPSAWPEL